MKSWVVIVTILAVVLAGGAYYYYGGDTWKASEPSATTYTYVNTFHIFDCIEFSVSNSTLYITPAEPQMMPNKTLMGNLALDLIPLGNYEKLQNNLAAQGITAFDPETFTGSFMRGAPALAKMKLYAEAAVANGYTPTVVEVTATANTFDGLPPFERVGVLVNGTLYDGTTMYTGPESWVSRMLTSASGGRYIWVLKVPIVPTVDHWGVMNTFYYANLSPGIPTNTTRTICG